LTNAATCYNRRGNRNYGCGGSQGKCATEYYTDGTRVDGEAITRTIGVCIEESNCGAFTMDNYVPNDQRIVNVEDDFIVALCFDDVADYANALIYMNSVTLVEYTERAEELNEPLALEREEREE